MAALTADPFHLERHGIILDQRPGDPDEAWGVLNPGGTCGPDGAFYLFPRLVACGNYSRIGCARITFDKAGTLAAVERLGLVLEPRESYEVSRAGGGVEDPRVTYVEALGQYVMAYTAYIPHHPRIALAVSRDLQTWTRLGPLHFSLLPDGYDLNKAGNKDGVVFPDLLVDPLGRPAFAIMHRPTLAVDYHRDGCDVTLPPCGVESQEHIWISYVPLDRVQHDIHQLTQLSGHRQVLAPQAAWEQVKIGSGPPPVRLPYGWLLLYHGVSRAVDTTGERIRYSVGAAILDLEDPTRVLYRSPHPILEPDAPYEAAGRVSHVVFPTATDLHPDGRLDVYYGAADSRIGLASTKTPPELPTGGSGGVSPITS
ncbi:MAG TPA: hypothetical protein VF807_12745 [Ktedonobacterales bacterium]